MKLLEVVLDMLLGYLNSSITFDENNRPQNGGFLKYQSVNHGFHLTSDI